MPDVQAFPAVVQAGPRRRRKKRHVSSTPRRRVSRQRLRSNPRHHSRTRRRSRSRPVRVEPVRPRPRRIVRPLYRRRYLSPCTPFPMCERNCLTTPYRGINRPYYADNYGEYYAGEQRPRSITPRRLTSDAGFYAEDRPVPGLNAPYYAESKTSRGPPSRLYYAKSRHANCCCNTCKERLQFIQPGLCNKKKNVWTNEYAVIPAPQVNLIDPCEELDPTIYPRAENPCLRDGQGNPLTDCIGRPLRSPIGKRFLKFSANGSVMDTSLRGNFWTGQPPLCVKCPMPSCSCGPDTTHNWWMGCGYPILPNMDPFYKQVIAAETANC